MSRSVLLIGSSSPIGRAIAEAFARTGDRVVGVCLDDSTDPALTENLPLDVSTPQGADEAVRRTVERLGGLDVLVLAAAVMAPAAAHRAAPDDWYRAIDNTLHAAFFPARAALPLLPPGGSIVAVSSVNATLAAPWLPGYSAAKAAVEGLVRQLALDYGGRGIRVNAVAPGMIGNADLPQVTEGYPLGRVGRPADVAEAVLYLAAADFVTGAVLPVDGGLSIASPAAFLRPDLRERLRHTQAARD
ncbi:SDR family NAD(P)-dependent oxidoreductase [Streptacidiphilus sp. P02-A3a]|uniref:SDR family NAD(P)-dependent oxidoreductase n=1 Tax=Streptacidiphilus sp. P02-A3a TaxID=2704468 RepID=UPI0015F9B7B2|nr:SDR family oxidoreductase [Streptacidiphilus sp. P02-A3a]QMU70164.1 SDR family oxidoreductase [Streptacidiphilus sp. P02-A3a]QMU70386.1 SDR family oxidoreductase [Streptacidiphilus sp. P02-A3a]